MPVRIEFKEFCKLLVADGEWLEEFKQLPIKYIHIECEEEKNGEHKNREERKAS